MTDFHYPRYISRAELVDSATATRLGISNEPPKDLEMGLYELAWWLRTLRDRIAEIHGQPCAISISSGYRCPKLNKTLRGSKSSTHMEGLAADFTVAGMSTRDVVHFISTHMQNKPFDQAIDEYGRWVHVGLGSKSRRQTLVAVKRPRTLMKPKTVYLPFSHSECTEDFYGAV